MEGYQLQSPPEGFLYVVSQEPGQGPLPGWERLGQGVWMGDFRSDEPRSWFEFTRYRGSAVEDDARAAREARAGILRGSPYNSLGPLRTVPLAEGGMAWAWTEERRDDQGRLRSLQVTAILSFDTVAFGLELDTNVAERMAEEHLDAVVATFAPGRTRVHWQGVLGAGLAALALGLFLARRMGRRGHTAYRLATPPRAPLPSPPSSDPPSTSPGAPS